MKENEVHELLVKLRNGDEYTVEPLIGILDVQFYERARKQYGLKFCRILTNGPVFPKWRTRRRMPYV